MKDPNGNISILSIALFAYQCVGIVEVFAPTFVQNVKSKVKKKINKVFTPSYPNYSKELNRVVEKNVKTVKKKSPVFHIVWFEEQVKSGGPWDYKVPNIWKNEIKEPYLGLKKKFIWNNIILDAENFGNMHYGIVGTAMGYSPFILFNGGGYASKGLIRMVSFISTLLWR